MECHGTRVGQHRLNVVALSMAVVLLAAVMPKAALALPGEHNRLPEVCQGVAGAGYVANEVAALLTPVPYDLAPSAGAFAGNWALRLCPPQIVAPADKKFEPDAVDATSSDPEMADPYQSDPSCYASVSQNTTKDNYDNLLGIPFSLGDWGDLGTPDVYHFNTSADVRILGSDRADDPATSGDESLADELPTSRDSAGREIVKIPVGRNYLTYRADTLVSVLDFAFIYVPKIPSGTKAYKEMLENSGKFKRAAIKGYQAFAGAVEVVNNPIGDFALDQIINVNFRHSQLGVLDDIYNQDSQEVWVYDRIPPVLTTRTDVSTLPERVRAVLSYDAARDVYYLEAIHPGGIQSGTGVSFLERLLDYHDHCDRQVRLSNDGGGAAFWPTGSSLSLQWTASDPGPRDVGGAVNSVSLTQQIEVRDSYPPVLVAPPSQVLEIPSGESQATVELGAPRVFDLADLTPDVDNDAVSNVFQLGLTEVTWMASDGFNTSEAVQLINVKEEGTNTAPSAEAQSVETRSFEETEIVLSGSDADYHPSVDRYDPLTFSIVAKPDNGFFVAPLLPYFIEDYRLEAGALRFADQPWQQDPFQYCRDRGGSYGPGEPDAWEMGYPYFAQWMAVDDDGNTIVYDYGSMYCTGGSSGDLGSNPRFVVFDAQQDIVVTNGAPGEGQTVEDIYWHFDNGQIYVTVTDTQGDDYVHVYDRNLQPLTRYNMSDGTFPAPLNRPRVAAVDHRGILYVADNGTVNAYRQVSDVNFATAGEVFLGQAYNSQYNGIQSIALDSNNNLYVSFSDKIVKVAAAEIDTAGDFTAGMVEGWLGYCSGNLTVDYACDTPNRRSVGFMCTDELCERDGPYGNQPGQFLEAKGIAVDPNDILYVSDFGNERVQRFTPDGFFAGEAKSTGVGYGFLLGDFGNPDDIEVNSEHFYILNRASKLLHIFETTPITPIDDSHASVVYRSNNNFVGTDSFRFGVTDGLDSGEADVVIEVSRNFRPPEIPEAGRAVEVPPSPEDESAEFVVPATDPDGALDTLSVVLIRAPEHGEVTFDGLTASYVPDAHYNGPDSFSYRVSDGRETSEEVGEVALTIDPVEDTPMAEVEPQREVSVGFRLIHRVDVFDPDAEEKLRVTVDWGDGLSNEDGHFELDGAPIPAAEAMNDDGTIRDDVETTGPILSVDPMGRGVLIADHIYTRAGTYNVQTCVYDKVVVDPETQQKSLTGDSKSQCETTEVVVTASAELGIEVEGPEEAQTPGSDVEFIVTLRNLEFELDADDPRYAELPPTGTSILGLALNGEFNPHLELVAATSIDGTCAMQGAAIFDCLYVELPYGAAYTVVVQARLTVTAPGGAEPGLALEAEWLDMRAKAVGGGKVEVASSGSAPSLDSISPTSGAPEGFTEITLLGANFDSGARVLFGARPGTQVRVIDSTTLTALTPAQAPGIVDVTVINPDDQQSALRDALTYRADASSGGGSGGTADSGGGSGSGGGSLGAGTLLLFVFALSARLYWRRRRQCIAAGAAGRRSVR